MRKRVHPNRPLFFVALAALFLGACALLYSDISPERAHEMVASGAMLIDVRTAEEWHAGHIEGAVHIPVHLIQKRVAELGPKDTPIVVYCRSGARSSRAQGYLRDAGFTNVHNLGAMERW